MTWDFVLRLFVRSTCAVIGLDREYRAKEAGYRTHFLVSLRNHIDCFAIWLYGNYKDRGDRFRSKSCCSAGSERYRFYRCRHYHFSEANSAD